MNGDIAERLAFAHRLADSAGAVIRPFFRKPIAVDDKGDGRRYDPVTEADRAAETVIRKLIGEAYPDDGILGEELGDAKGSSGYRWVIDPIDGTRAFISGQPLWGTLIALEHHGTPVIGVLDQPVLAERFVGCNGKAELVTPEGTTALKTRACPGLKSALLSTTHPWDYFDESEGPAFVRLAQQVQMSRFGGDCYAYGLLASGFIDLVVEAQLHAWDVAALIPIIEGAGGSITDWNGKPVENGGRVIAAGDKRVHAEALAILQANA
jgi:histidinol phosphatase-like enzyme (inositol monophosphatase family)